MEQSQEYENIARASPVCDAQEPRLAAAISERRLPCPGRARLKKIAQRVGSLNVGSMTGRSREVADVMKRRKINILCVQELDGVETRPEILEKVTSSSTVEQTRKEEEVWEWYWMLSGRSIL